MTDEDVLAAAEAFGDALSETQSDAASAEFETTLLEHNEAISEAIGLEYGSVCDTDDCC